MYVQSLTGEYPLYFFVFRRSFDISVKQMPNRCSRIYRYFAVFMNEGFIYLHKVSKEILEQSLGGAT